MNFASLTYSLYSTGGMRKNMNTHVLVLYISYKTWTAVCPRWGTLWSFILFHLLCGLFPSGQAAATCQTFLHMHTSGTPSGSWQEPAAKKRGLANVLLLTRQLEWTQCLLLSLSKMAPFKHISREPVLTRFLFGSKWRDSCVTSSVSVRRWNDSVPQMSESILALCVKHKSGHCGSENKDNSGLAVSREQNGEWLIRQCVLSSAEIVSSARWFVFISGGWLPDCRINNTGRVRQ